ncbi:MAG: hypothetical protein AB7K09_06805 [Planctomycetota bacterium]
MVELILGQLLTAAVTIGAVWLTSKQAFDQSVRTTQYDDATRTVHMLHVIRAELQANMTAVEGYAAYIDSLEATDQEPDPARMFELAHDSFDAAPQNDRYYLLGSDTIVALRAFYRETDRLQADMKDTGKLGPGSGHVNPRSFRKVVRVRLTGLDTYIKQIRETLLPRLEQRVTDLEKTRREAYGPTVTPVPVPAPVALPRLDDSVDLTTDIVQPGKNDPPGRDRTPPGKDR